MKSTEGKHFVGLDQIRAVATFMVFVWHFRGRSTRITGPVEGQYDFFGFSIFNEGHTGVGLFMVLSGYLFVRLTEGREILIRPFLYNRFMRLAPLMIAVMLLSLVIAAFTGTFQAMLWDIVRGVVWPSWPSGGWSITIEAHFYLLFPFLLYFLRTKPALLLAVLVAAICFRAAVYELLGSPVERLAYQTIVGRIDQFMIGMLLGRFGGFLARRHLVVLGIGLTFMFVWQEFAKYGGFEGTHDDAKAWVWIWIPLLEAVAYGAIIAYYDRTFRPSKTGVSGFIARIGEWSFSIYLLHQFLVFYMASFINQQIVKMDSIYLLLAFSVPSFALTCLVSWATYEHFEKRFLRKRRPYLVGQKEKPVAPEPVVATAP